MPYSTLIFDLDGTLSDPAVGVIRCMNFALTSFDYSPLPEHEITQHIGPPLELTLGKLSGSEDPTHIAALAAKYRERYGELGFKENTLYPGIEHMLSSLRANGQRLGVCTSKLPSNAIKILERFKLIHYFEFVSGPATPQPKSQQLQELLATGSISEEALMIGDRAVDLQAAHSNSLKSAGVLWGYGDREELKAEGPAHLFASPEELTERLQR